MSPLVSVSVIRENWPVNQCAFANKTFVNSLKKMFRPEIHVPRLEIIEIDVHAVAEEALQYSKRNSV
jgi:hypothetical protein